ncbi:MAG TPA: hypothetical protein DCL72_13325 [Rhizobiales bacterium]|nr:hypothetical protein [Hyphomicrobiales bacterium]HAN62635.1 hypothetical protein [Hyphomicrobiales bacterium]HCL61550.1 hypothetical protein [Hyphomicrobiales bacterium]
MARLDRQAPPIGKTQLEPREAEPDGEGTCLDGARAQHRFKPRLQLVVTHRPAVNHLIPMSQA